MFDNVCDVCSLSPGGEISKRPVDMFEAAKGLIFKIKNRLWKVCEKVDNVTVILRLDMQKTDYLKDSTERLGSSKVILIGGHKLN